MYSLENGVDQNCALNFPLDHFHCGQMLGDITLGFAPIHRWGRGQDRLEGVG